MMFHKGQGTTDLFSQLPASLLAQVLQNVPQQQRLTQCALVSSTWSSAAALATVRVRGKLKAEAIPAFEAWLEQHAGQLLGLQVSLGIWQPQHTLHLRNLGKFRNLQKLQLYCFKLQLACNSSVQQSTAAELQGPTSPAGIVTGTHSSAAGSGAGAGAAVLPSLQDLELDTIDFKDLSSLLQLMQAPQLTSLTVENIKVLDTGFSSGMESHLNSEAAVQQMAEALRRLLQQLPRLAVVNIPGLPVTDAAAAQLGAMQALRTVKLSHAWHVQPLCLQRLPSSVTELHVRSSSSDFKAPSLPVQMAQLTALVHLELRWCAVPSVVLGSVPQLHKLYMDSCGLLPNDPVNDDEDHEFDTAGTEALLGVLPKLTALQTLELKMQKLDTGGAVALQRFSALTASTHLVELVVQPMLYKPLPCGAVQHMFPAGRQMPLLQNLTISPYLEGEPIKEEDYCMNSADIVLINKACPRLQWLDIGNALQPGADLSVLLQLPECCTSLVVGGAAFTDDAAPVLAQVTQLEYLCWNQSPGFTDAGLEQLLPLAEDLWRLHVYDCGLSVEVTSEDDPGTLDLECKNEASVSEQLDALCDLSPTCAPARLKKQRADNKQLQQEVSSLRRQLADRDAQIKQLQRQLAAAGASQQQ